MLVGDISIEPVHDGTAVLATDLFVNSDWTDHQHLLDSQGALTIPVGAFLVRNGDHLALLDAGVGDVHNDMFNGGKMLDSLRSLGVEPDQIDTIIVSHLHPDHMGWLAVDGDITFTNATVHIGAADWAYFVDEGNGGRRNAANLRTVEERVELVHDDGVTLLPGMTTRMTPGHTPGHMCTVISSGNERLIVLGDALHCPAQLTELEWEFLYDVDAALARKTRAALVEEGIAAQHSAASLPLRRHAGCSATSRWRRCPPVGVFLTHGHLNQRHLHRIPRSKSDISPKRKVARIVTFPWGRNNSLRLAERFACHDNRAQVGIGFCESSEVFERIHA